MEAVLHVVSVTAMHVTSSLHGTVSRWMSGTLLENWCHQEPGVDPLRITKQAWTPEQESCDGIMASSHEPAVQETNLHVTIRV